MSTIEVDKIIPQSGTALQVGEASDTINVPSGATLNINSGATITNNGTASGFDTDTNDKVKVSTNDTTPGFLNGKLVAGTNISLTEGSDGGNETLTAALSGTITPSDNTVTLAKMAPGTDGNIISYDASGNPVAVATGSSGQVLTSAGAGAVPSFQTAAAGGKILQVVYASTTAEKVVSSATFVDSGLSASITPSATSSKVLIICEIASCGKAGSNTRVVLKLLKGSSDLITFAQEVGETQSTDANKVGNSGCTFLDSPNTTSSTTYKVQMNSGAGTSYAQTGGSGATSTMTLMEVAG